MTDSKHLKTRVRARMTKTGERYTAARRHVLAQAPSRAGSPPSPADAPALLTGPGPAAAAPTAGEPSPAAAASPLPRPGTSISDQAVRARTGLAWSEWFALLDAAGAAQLDHRGVVALASRHGAGSWWQQTVAVEYERARGRRVLHQTADGFTATVSKTIAAPLGRVWGLLADDRRRDQLLGAGYLRRSASAGKALRLDGPQASRVEIRIAAKGERCQVAVEHSRLADVAAVAAAKAAWRERLAALAAATAA
jgi:hypothetical protein